MEEIWLKYDENYEVSNTGKVRSVARVIHDTIGRKRKLKSVLLRQRISTSGYYYVALSAADRNTVVHRMAGKLFVPNPENKPYINHIDGNKLNNHVTNLEWCTKSENAIHAVKTGLTKIPGAGQKFGKHFNGVKVDQYSKDGVFIKTWGSFTEVEDYYKCRINISACCSGKRPYAMGFKWKYHE